MTVPYGPVGRCIYCGAERYSVDRKRLGDEHIIPKALGGTLILAQASCGKCERIINKAAETPMLRHSLVLLRNQLGMPFTKKPKTLRATFLHRRGYHIERVVPIDEYPASGLFLELPRPGLLRPHDPEGTMIGVAFPWYENNITRALAKTPYGFTAPTVHLNAYSRFFAKIAHSYAIAKLGTDYFEPLLRDFILRDNESQGFEYVGGLEGQQLDTGARHGLQLGVYENYLVVLIRLFADIRAPTHAVLTGLLKDPAELASRDFQIEECA